MDDGPTVFYNLPYDVKNDKIKPSDADDDASEVDIIPKHVDYTTARGIRLMSYAIDSPSHFLSALGYAAKMPATIGNISIRGIKEIIAGKEKAYNLVSGDLPLISKSKT